VLYSPLSSALVAILACSLFSATLPNAFVSIADAQTLDPSCVLYETSTETIRLKCGNATLVDIETVLEDGDLLTQEPDKIWVLDANLVVENAASLSITSNEVSWLRIETPHGLESFGDILIDSVKITSWDSSIGNYALTDGQQPRSYIVAWEDGAGHLNITNSEIAYLGYDSGRKQGLAYYGGHGSSIKNNNIHHMWYGFYSDNVGFISIENNRIHDNIIYGLDPHAGSHDMIISNNVVNNITRGAGIICSVDCYNIVIENNVVYDVGIAGIMLSRNTTNSIIRDNVVYDSGATGAGISIDNSRSNKVYNNVVSIGKYGIKVATNASHNLIYNNTISNYASYGLCVIDNSSYNTVYDNIISNIAEHGICATKGSSDNKIFSNKVVGAGYYGIYVRDLDTVENEFSFNSVSDSKQSGIRLLDNTESSFIDNSVGGSAKSDYSAGSARLRLYNSSFSATYFDGTDNEVSIVNSDSRVIIGDRKLDNTMASDGRVSVHFGLTNGDRAVLSTVPFVIRPQGSDINVSILDGSIESNSARITWSEKTIGGENTLVYHRVEGLDPGIPVALTTDDVESIRENLTSQDGVLEFATEQGLSETIYSLQSSGDGGYENDSEIRDLFGDPSSQSILRSYRCEIYASVVRCDPQVSDFASYSVEGKLKAVQLLSAPTASFVDGKYGEAVKLSARYRESIEVMNTPAIANDEFSISFWVRNSDESEPYGHIISHVNFGGTAGWLVDMTSSTSSQPFVQRLQFGVTNTQGNLIAPPEVEIPQERFVHVAGVFDGSVVRTYIDGKLAGEVPFSGSYNPDPGTPLRMGSASYSTSTNRWSGVLDDLWLFDRALMEDEVMGIAMQKGAGEFIESSPNDSGLVARWTFEDNVNDLSGNGNDGSLSTLLASMAFTPDGRLFFSEKNTGNIKIMKDDMIFEEPFAHLPDVYVSWEQGLLGLTLDSRYEENRYVYQYYTYMDPSGQVFNRLVRFKDVDNKGTEMKILLDKIPAVKGYHSGGALAFGPDDKLYVTVGDATEHPFAQDPNTLIGKVLRINRDGTVPADNPDPNSYVYTKGHRNAYGLAFDGMTTGIITENGEAAYDEINVITRGGNYGFPTFQPANIPPELADPSTSILPARSYYETVAPTQAIFYTGDKIPELTNMFLFGTFTGDIYAVAIDPDTKKVIAEERIDLYPTLFTPVIGIAQAPNGDIYYGSYSIFKLESLDLSTRMLDSYPINIAGSAGVVVNDLVFDQDRMRITLDVSTMTQISGNTSDTSPKETPASVSIRVPKTLMDEITTVVDESDNTPLRFTVTTGGGAISSGGYNDITVLLDDTEQDSQVSVIAARVIPEFPVTQIWIIVFLLGLVMVAFTVMKKLQLDYPGRM